VPGLRALLRQRTRWSQGNLQALDLLGAIRHSPFPRLARAGGVLYLLMPLWQTVVGAAIVCSVVLSVAGFAPLGLLAVVYLLGFSNAVLGYVAACRPVGRRSWWRAVGAGHLYAVYTWLAYPALLRAHVRQVGMRRDWARTERVPLEISAG
jgi:cellulose synthase/poly-beta-1,6-N-acetylglucosamine synthase-like glycosyltransferase